MSNFALFLIYPRPACIIAFACLFIPKWRGYALQLLFADFILNLLCFGMTEFKSIATYPPNPTNPLLPTHSLHMYQLGFMVSIGTGYAVYAVLMSFTSLGVLDLIAGIFSKDNNYEYKIFGAVFAFVINPFLCPSLLFPAPNRPRGSFILSPSLLSPPREILVLIH
jgi:hypothetical protein